MLRKGNISGSSQRDRCKKYIYIYIGLHNRKQLHYRSSSIPRWGEQDSKRRTMSSTDHLYIGTILFSLFLNTWSSTIELVNDCESNAIRKVAETKSYRLLFHGHDFPQVCKAEFIGRDLTNQEHSQACLSTEYIEVFDCYMKVFIYEGYISTPIATYTCKSSSAGEKVCMDVQKHLRIELIYHEDAYSVSYPNVVNISFLITGKNKDDGVQISIIASVVSVILVLIALSFIVIWLYHRRKKKKLREQINESVMSTVESTIRQTEDHHTNTYGCSPDPYDTLYPENSVHNIDIYTNAQNEYNRNIAENMMSTTAQRQRSANDNLVAVPTVFAHNSGRLTAIPSDTQNCYQVGLPSYAEAMQSSVSLPPSYKESVKYNVNMKKTGFKR